MLKLRDLAKRTDFQAGPLQISPSRRCVTGPAGSVHLEPLIMHVFLLLLDADGRVVTRDELFEQCWGGTIVGDDSLNRAIAKVRRIAVHTAPGLFEIETVPRTGYRLTGEIVRLMEPDTSDDEPLLSAKAPGSTRRSLMVGAGAALTCLGGTAWWWSAEERSDRRFRRLLEYGHDALLAGTDYDPAKSQRALEEAIRIRPGSSHALGLLALALHAQARQAPPATLPRLMEKAGIVARRALAIDADEPNALLAATLVQGATIDLFARDQVFRRVIALDPGNIFALTELTVLTQIAGLNRESWQWNERALAITPLSYDFLTKRALKLWIAERPQSADKVIDQVRAMWPNNRFVWYARILILATTGRALAAKAMLEGEPEMVRRGAIGPQWHTALDALIEPSPARIEQARRACVTEARRNGHSASEGVMLLAAMGATDAAFEIANGFLLWRGNVVRQGRASVQRFANDALMRVNTQWLFTPPCKIMRADSRFLPLCEGIGLTDYWREREVKPDYLLSQA